MSIRPDLQMPVATAQAIVDCVLVGHTVAAVSKIYGGEIAAIYEIALGDAEQPVVLKVYPESLHWKMQKEVTVTSLIQARLSAPVPRILLADDSKRLLGLNFILMTKLAGSILGRLEPTLTQDQRVSAHRQIGLLLREFHRIPMEAFGYIGASGTSTAHLTNHDYLSFQFDKKLKEFTEKRGAGRLQRDRTTVLGTDVGFLSPLFSARTLVLDGPNRKRATAPRTCRGPRALFGGLTPPSYQLKCRLWVIRAILTMRRSLPVF